MKHRQQLPPQRDEGKSQYIWQWMKDLPEPRPQKSAEDRNSQEYEFTNDSSGGSHPQPGRYVFVHRDQIRAGPASIGRVAGHGFRNSEED